MSNQQKLANIKEDIQQLQTIISSSKSQRIKQMLQKNLVTLKNELTKIQKSILDEQQKKNQQTNLESKTQKKNEVKSTTSNILYTPLTKYSWQDQSKKVKIYFSLENISSQVPAQNLDIQFLPNSVQLKIRGYKKQNLLFSIKKTYAQIIPEQCFYLQKTNHLAITLTKKSSGTWTQLNFKEDKFKTKDTKEEFSDPNASIMNMMKKMYEDGDQNMKRTIAQAWTKSRDKNPKDGFKFD